MSASPSPCSRTDPHPRSDSHATPNAFFFFLDRLQEQPPFGLEDDTSWDTNIADGVRWGIKMVDLDEELYGRRPSTRAFLILSDGQDWSGEVEDALGAGARPRESVCTLLVSAPTSAA